MAGRPPNGSGRQGRKGLSLALAAGAGLSRRVHAEDIPRGDGRLRGSEPTVAGDICECGAVALVCGIRATARVARVSPGRLREAG